MKKITDALLRLISDFSGEFKGAFNLREDGECAGRMSSKIYILNPNEDAPGLVIRVLPGTKGETVYIRLRDAWWRRRSGVQRFLIGEGADVTIVAGCGVHAEEGEEARHNGIHRFFVEKRRACAL